MNLSFIHRNNMNQENPRQFDQIENDQDNQDQEQVVEGNVWIIVLRSFGGLTRISLQNYYWAHNLLDLTLQDYCYVQDLLGLFI